VGQIPANIQWQLRPVDGKAGIYYIVNVGHKMFLDTHGGSVRVWGDGVDVGHVPQNIQWALKIVTG
jgi:predicted Rossmann fold nucleotide-binding protein DprA/Smf involved in DNA uptake